MFIAVRHGKRGSWELISEQAPSEIEDDGVETVPVGQLRELVPDLSVTLEGFELPDERVIDLVGVDPEGNLTLGMCRLARTAEERQVCVARLMELASRLRDEVSPREFERRIEALNRSPLEDLVVESLDEDEQADFDPDFFRRRLAQNLERGRFRLVLAVNEIGEEFRSFLDYLSETSEGYVHFYPIEFAIFTCGEHDVLVPRATADSWVEWEELENDPVYEPVSDDEEFDPATFLDLLQELAEREDISADAFDSLEEVLRDPSDAYGDSGEAWSEEAKYEPLDVEMTIAGPDPVEDAFFSRLSDLGTIDSVRRARRLIRLGREPSRTMPAGWVMAEDTLSFQATMYDESRTTPEPTVMELFRLECDGLLTLDVPNLRARLPEPVVRAFVIDLETNPLLSASVRRSDDTCEVSLEQVFLNDRDVRVFCVAIRKLVMGCGRSVEGA